ncbi:MAG: restriction endonuclease subunit S [Pirellulaceae bacterium]
MKNGWQYKKVSEIAKHSLGKMLDKAKNKGEPKPYLRNLNVRWFDFDLSDVLEMRFLPEEVSKFTAVKGDVLICEGGYPGRAAIWEQDEPIYFQKALHRVRFHEPDRSKWFVYYLYAKDLDGTLKNHFNGAGIQHFTGESLAQFEVPIPPLPEQQRIVGILDEAFDGIATAKANAEKNRQNARALFESHVNAVFAPRGEGWMERTLGEMATFRNGINFTKSSRGAQVKIVGVKDFQRNFWAPLEGLDTVISEGSLPDSDALKENDLLFVRSNGNMELIGRSLLVGAVSDRITHSGFTIRARLHRNGVLAKYVCRFVKSNDIRRKMIDSGIGTNIKSLNQTTLAALVVPLPSLAEQTQIAEQLDAMESETQRLATLYEQKLAAIDELKKSLLYQAFSGQL